MFSARSPFPTQSACLVLTCLKRAMPTWLRGGGSTEEEEERGPATTGEEEGEATAADCIEEIVAHLVALNSNQRLETCIHAVPADFVSTVSVKCE